jgi:hypothetical protein
MTLANMRTNGVRSLCVTCKLCHHEAVMNVDAFDGERLEYARCRRSPLSDGGARGVGLEEGGGFYRLHS